MPRSHSKLSLQHGLLLLALIQTFAVKTAAPRAVLTLQLLFHAAVAQAVVLVLDVACHGVEGVCVGDLEHKSLLATKAHCQPREAISRVMR